MLRSGSSRSGERPATFREVFASTEFRAIYTASTLSWVGDYLARAAITVLAFEMTHSAAASAAAFAISYAPWLIGGSVLVSLADRYPYRSVMVFCDVARMMLMAVVAIPGIPLGIMLILLLCSAMLGPPFDAARSATLPSVLEGDRYVVGVAVHGTTIQPAQVAGYFVGAAIAAYDARIALLINAASFGISAVLVRSRVRLRQPALDSTRRTHLLSETADGFRLVFATPVLRALVLVVFSGSVFAVVPEGLGAVWASQLAAPADRGWVQGMIMGAVPAGYIIGAISISRLVVPATRRRLIRPIAVAIPIALVPAILNPPALVVAALAATCGFAMGSLVPVANGMFVQVLPNEYRARAFGVVQAGLQLLQGGAVLATGALAQDFQLPAVVGMWSLAGVGLMLLLVLSWPPQREFDAAFVPAATTAGPAPGDAGTAPAGAERAGLASTVGEQRASTADLATTVGANEPRPTTRADRDDRPDARTVTGSTRGPAHAPLPGTIEP